jgi:glycosyltransferase involved in cell wall biosynthesis
MKSVIHIGLWHTVEDSRVFYRECVSLSKKYAVALICVGDETKEYVKDGVRVFQIEKRFYPFFFVQAFFRAISLPGEVYHVHEVDSLLLAFFLKTFHWNKKVVFDVHEYYEDYALDKRKKLNKKAKLWFKTYTFLLKPILSRFCKGIITINPLMKEDYSRLNKSVEVIYNFPESSLLNEVKPNGLLDTHYDYLLYHGGIKEDRGILLYPRLLNALEDENVRLLVIGGFVYDNLKQRFNALCKELDIEHRVITTGQLAFKETISYLKNNVRYIGLSLFTYQNDHRKAINMKIFEYLYLGIPQVGSDWRIYFNKFILDNQAGIGADYYDINSQIKAVKTIFSNYETFRNRCLEFKDNYTWETEKNKLFRFYEKISI